MSGATSASFVYDGDGRRIKATVNGVTSYCVGDHYEVSGEVVKKYYTAGGQRIALRSGGALHWLLTDHLGGTAYTVSGTTETGELRYRPFGVTRFTSGTMPTTYRFTGQREEAALGLYFYNARWYDPTLGRFIQPDTLVPDPADARMFDRYAYVNNNPLKFSDPTGHEPHMPNDPCSYEHCRWDPLAGKYVRVSYAPPDMQFEPQVDPKLAALTELLRRAATMQLHYTEQGEIDFQKTLETELGEAMSVCAKAVGGVCGMSLGASGSVVALGGKASVDLFVDQQGEMAGYVSAGGGGYAVFSAANLSALGIAGIAAHGATVDDMAAWSVQFGGSGKLAAGMAVEWIVGRNSDGDNWHGLLVSQNAGLGLEVHATTTYSWLVYRSRGGR